jgi:DNA replication and repair protein RecF
LARVLRMVVQDFRNIPLWEATDLADACVVALVGPNGAGKTSVLEALSLLGGGRGLLGGEAKEQLRDGSRRGGGWGVFAALDDLHEVGVAYQGGKKLLRVDGTPATNDELAQVVPLVWMAPGLDRLFFESPGVRREWLDDLASAVVRGHDEAVKRYVRHLRSRLKLLGERAHHDWLEAEERQAAVWGVKVLEGRAAYVKLLNEVGGGVRLRLEGNAATLLTEEDPVGVLQGKFERSREIDARLERTSAGPNTIDVQADVVLEESEVAMGRASSGQHKRGLVRLLLAHVRLVRAKLGVAPLVLIDEFSAHLDAGRRALLLDELVALGAQVWCTDTAFVDARADVRVITLA